LTVTILTAENCGFCEEAKRLLGKLAPEYGFTIELKDFNSDEGQALATEGMLMFPPGIVIDGRPFSYGRPSEKAIRRELAKLSVVAR
jgi:glutaredoxin